MYPCEEEARKVERTHKFVFVQQFSQDSQAKIYESLLYSTELKEGEFSNL